MEVEGWSFKVGGKLEAMRFLGGIFWDSFKWSGIL